nr:uncharacterized protein LOC127310657 [Lolium perenne]
MAAASIFSLMTGASLPSPPDGWRLHPRPSIPSSTARASLPSPTAPTLAPLLDGRRLPPLPDGRLPPSSPQRPSPPSPGPGRVDHNYRRRSGHVRQGYLSYCRRSCVVRRWYAAITGLFLPTGSSAPADYQPGRPPPTKKKAASSIEPEVAAPGVLEPREKPKVTTPHRREAEGMAQTVPPPATTGVPPMGGRGGRNTLATAAPSSSDRRRPTITRDGGGLPPPPSRG